MHRWLVHGLEHTPPGPLSLLEPLRVELLQEVGDRFVELIEGKEPPVAEPGENLALDDQDSSLHGCLIVDYQLLEGAAIRNDSVSPTRSTPRRVKSTS